ncbi:MAG: hypothetical protein AAF081_04565 [Actinomycetota bacterium]
MNETNQTDQILETLRPRMQAARVGHLRRLFAGVAAIPLFGIGAMAMAGTAGDGAEIETAAAPALEDDPTVALPEIGAAGGDETNADPVGDEDAEGDVADEPVDEPVETTTTTTEAPDPDAPVRVDLGALGTVDVEPDGDAFAVLDYGFSDGWEVLSTDVIDGVLVLVIGNADGMKVIMIEPGVRDEISVIVDEFVLPATTTTVKPEPRPDPDPDPAPVVDRFVVDVAGKGSFVVEREGETLYLGEVTAYEGYEYEVQQAQGWKVYVGFFTDDHVYFGKALINDAGEVEQHFWDESLAPQPVYQWAEIGGVGAAKFEVYDGLIRLVKTETAEGFESWDYNQGAAAPTIKVDFEGEEQIWFIDAWLNENGELVWNSYQGG